MTRSSNKPPRPFLKWPGGKTQLLPELLGAVQKAEPFNNYHEPFLGGGALFFALSQHLPPRKILLSDFNPNLIEAYQAIAHDFKKVVQRLKTHAKKHSIDYYYMTRESIPKHPVDRAARIIYLNKTCYNGLYRENSRGLFNVPIGSYKNPNICDEENIFACSVALKNAYIDVRSFESVLDMAKTGDFVYCDPPYHPISLTSSFTAYEKSGFGENKQILLAHVFKELDKCGVRVLLSNSDAPLIRSLYKTFKIKKVLAKRSVNCQGTQRGKITELLIQNY